MYNLNTISRFLTCLSDTSSFKPQDKGRTRNARSSFVTSIFIFILSVILLVPMSPNQALAAEPNSKTPFPDYRISNAKDQLQTLKKEVENISDDDAKTSQERAEVAVGNKSWDQAIAEFSRVVGHTPENRKAWRNLSLALQRKSQEREDWRSTEDSKLAAINLYLLAKTPEDKAEALLIYGNAVRPDDESEDPSYFTIYEMAQSLTDIGKLKAADPELAPLMAFKFNNIQVNNQASPPNVCFNFTHPLMIQKMSYEDFFSISPKTEGSLKASGRDLCFTPVRFGINYDVILKAGIKDIYSEKIPSDIKLSFKVKDQPSLLSFKTKAYVLRKEEKALIPLSGVNVDAVDIKIMRINDRSLNQPVGQSKDFLTRLWEYSVEQISDIRGETLYQGNMEFTKAKNETITKLIPFSEVVKKTEPGIYIIQATEKGTVIGNRANATQWVIISDLGLTTLTQNDGGIWVNVRSLQSASPAAGIELKLLSYNNTILQSVTSNKDGMAFFPATVTKGKGGNRPLLVLAYKGKDDFSFLSLEQPAFDLSDRGVSGRKISGALDAFLYSEQGVYRPGDTVHINALLRDDKANAKGGLPLTFRIMRSDGVLVSEHSIQGNPLGFYELAVPLQGSSRTGLWTVQAYLDPKQDAIGRVQFSVEDFVPSRITVKLSSKASVLVPKEEIPVSITAKYLFGSPAGGLTGDGTLTLRARPNPFPKWRDYSFGLITDTFKDTKTTLGLNPLDKEGKGEITAQIKALPDTTVPLEAVIKVNLSDKGGRPEIGSLVLPVQSSPIMIGIKPTFKINNTAVLPDTENEAVFDVITIDNQQNLESVKNLEYELYEEQPHYTWYQPDRYSPWQYQTRLQDKFLAKGTVSTEKEAPQKLTLPLVNWGQYRLEIRDPKTNIATSVRFNKGFESSGDSTETPDKITVRVNQDRIPPNGQVELQIESPFTGQALLTVANNKVLETRNITVSPKGTRVTLTANAEWGTGVYCLVSAFRPLSSATGVNNGSNGSNAKGNDSGNGTNGKASNSGNSNNSGNQQKSFLPKRAVGLAWVGIDPKDRILNIAFQLPEEVTPRQTIEIPITVSQNGKGLAGSTQVSIAAVDEGILKITDFQTPKPQDYFFGKYRLSVELRDLYGKLIDPLPGVQGELKVGGDEGLLSRNLQALSKRSFKVVSLYEGLIDLDKNGQGQLKLTLPDFNGRLKLMAIAFNEKGLGSSDAALLVRDPIVVEGVLPRFLAPKDKTQLSVSLHNVKGPIGEYQMDVKVSGQLKLEGNKKTTFKLNKDEVKDFTFPITAETVGNGNIDISLTGNGINIERHFEISVRPGQPYQLKSFSQRLKPEEEAKLQYDTSKDFVPGSELAALSWSTTVPWNTQAIFKQLADYSYSCVEQTTSKGFGFLFGDKDQYNTNQMIAKLSEQQSGSGYYTLWNSSLDIGDIFLTSYVMDFLLHAQDQKIIVPKYTLERGLNWLSQSIQSREYDNYTITEATYALYVLTKADQMETGTLRYFFDSYLKNMQNPLARAFIGNALARRGDIARAKEAFHQILDIPNLDGETPYGTQLRDKLAVLSLMNETLEVAPSMTELNDSLQRLMAILQKELTVEGNISRLSTQELAWAVLAAESMSENTDSSDNNDAKASAMLTDKQTSNNLIEVKMGEVNTSEKDTVLSTPVNISELNKGFTIRNEGKQSLWQNLLISGLPKEIPKAESNGIEIERKFYTLEGDKISPNNLKQGSQMVVVIEGIVKDESAHELILVDYLAAGLEIENARLGQNGLSESMQWLEAPTKAEHTELRDDRFITALWMDGKTKTFRSAYIVRAITPGTYHYPGSYVEDMYAPDFFGRTQAEKVQVVAP